MRAGIELGEEGAGAEVEEGEWVASGLPLLQAVSPAPAKMAA